MKVLSAIGETKKGFKCLNGRILKNLDYVKNGHDNCGDNSDEKSKLTINITQSSYVHCNYAVCPHAYLGKISNSSWIFLNNLGFFRMREIHSRSY